MTFDKSPHPIKLSPLVDDDDVDEEEGIENNIKVVNNNNIEDENKAKLVAQGYNQQEGIDYDKTYTSVARLESIRILLAIACAYDFKLYQMDIKSAFLNDFINEEGYVAQPLEFEMSMMEELNFFLGLQIKQMKDGIFFNQSKYIKEMLKKFRLEDSKPTKTPMSTEIKLTKDDEADSVDSTKYRGDYVDRKSTSGVCTFMGFCLTSLFSKKQMALAISTTEAEYVSARKACQQALCMKQALMDYDIRLDDVPIMCDNKGAIDLQMLGKALANYYEAKLLIFDCHSFLHAELLKGSKPKQ
uniref:Copia protein n=1 Tax=Tanacetum cinerariifolium TaxID=118510 RepID=A0A699HNC2_TANCI|nr:copia protein [Tanacetum cinerariifolium]